MALIATGRETLDKLCTALGLDDRLGVRKVVIECAVDDVCRVYVAGYPTVDQMDQVAEAVQADVEHVLVIPVADVDVADDCTVTPIPTGP